jgi:hypothetical protein
MLRINLLPPERRRLKRPPLYALIPLALGVALCTAAVAVSFYFYFWMSQIEADIEIARQEHDQLKNVEKVETRHSEKTAELKAIRDGVANINSILDEKTVEWAEILDALTEVASRHPSLWYEKIETMASGAAGSYLRSQDPKATGGSFGLQVECSMAPDKVVVEGKETFQSDPERMMKFREDLHSHPRIKALFGGIWPRTPEWVRVASADTQEGFYIKFTLRLISVK